jgi:hypothetical protein
MMHLSAEESATISRLHGRHRPEDADFGRCSTDAIRDICLGAIIARRQNNFDDEQPAELDWLNGLRRKDGDMSWLCLRLIDRRFHLMAPGKVTEGIDGLKDHVSPRPATKGDVRMLAYAIGVELIESR